MMRCLIFLVSLVTIFSQTAAAPNATNFETTFLPYDARLMASIGNGYLATAVYSDTVYVSGVFNGHGTSTPSHRARIPSTASIVVDIDAHSNSTNQTFSLNVRNAVFYYKFQVQNFTLEHRVYAHRFHTNLIVNEISFWNLGPVPVIVGLSKIMGAASQDIDLKPYVFTQREGGAAPLNRSEPNDYKAMYGYTKIPEEPDSPKVRT